MLTMFHAHLEAPKLPTIHIDPLENILEKMNIWNVQCGLKTVGHLPSWKQLLSMSKLNIFRELKTIQEMFRIE